MGQLTWRKSSHPAHRTGTVSRLPHRLTACWSVTRKTRRDPGWQFHPPSGGPSCVPGADHTSGPQISRQLGKSRMSTRPAPID